MMKDDDDWPLLGRPIPFPSHEGIPERWADRELSLVLVLKVILFTFHKSYTHPAKIEHAWDIQPVEGQNEDWPSFAK